MVSRATGAATNYAVGCPAHEQDRMMRVPLGFMVLLVHPKVTIKKAVTPAGEADRFRVALPKRYDIERIVDDDINQSSENMR